MTFERAYGQWLVRNLNGGMANVGLKGKVCKQYDEVAFKPLLNDPEGIAVVISGGNATKSNVQGLDQNILPLTVTVICKTDYSDRVRQAIGYLQESFNAQPLPLVYGSGNGEDVKQRMKSVFTTPFVFDESDYPTKNATVKASFISFSATVLYGVDAVVYPPELQLSVGGIAYEIKNVSSYDSASVPSYDTTLTQGEDRASQVMLSKTNSWAFTIVKVEADPLQEIFEQELDARNGLADKDLTLIRDGLKIGIRTYQLTTRYENNTAVYVLTLGY